MFIVKVDPKSLKYWTVPAVFFIDIHTPLSVALVSKVMLVVAVEFSPTLKLVATYAVPPTSKVVS